MVQWHGNVSSEWCLPWDSGAGNEGTLWVFMPHALACRGVEVPMALDLGDGFCVFLYLYVYWRAFLGVYDLKFASRSTEEPVTPGEMDCMWIMCVSKYLVDSYSYI